MSRNTIVLVSRNPVDILFAQQVSKTLKIEFAHVMSKASLHEILSANLGSFILWDYDSVLEARPAEEKMNRELTQYFAENKIWNRVFALSSRPLRDSILPGNFHLFAKYLHRNSGAAATNVYAHVIRNVLLSDPFETASQLEETQTQRIRINNSARKKATLQALPMTLEKRGVPKRLISSIVHSTDELILNALFDAPRNEAGKAYKHAQNRGMDFSLAAKEEVEIELITTPSFLQVSVTDYFGSLEKEKFIPLLAKNFQKQEVADSDKANSGLGLYQILNSGLSLECIVEPGKRTRMSLTAPWVNNVRELRDSFRFFTFRVKN